MSYYSSSNYLSSSSYNYFNNYPSSSNYNNSYDSYRSYSNLRSLPYDPPKYTSSIPYSFSSRIGRSTSTDKDLNNGNRISITTTRSRPTSNCSNDLTRSTTSLYTKTTIDDDISYTRSPSVGADSSRSRRLSSCCDDLGSSNSINVVIKSRDESTEYISRPSTPSNLIVQTTNSLSNSNTSIHTSINSAPNRVLNSTDLSASAISNIQLNNTDDLMTQVDYCLNEVDYRMICRGKLIEIESSDLSAKSGLISKCLYINDLLTEANMSELNLDSDPTFTQHGKAILIFSGLKDAEAFANQHSRKFQVQFTNTSDQADLNSKNTKKNVRFIENDSYDDRRLNSSKSSDPITGRFSVGVNSNGYSNDSAYNSTDYLRSNDNNVLISANSSKNKNKIEGYEILTIKAKLKQRVNQNRTEHVTLHDIDAIMRNVVTIIQNEFMKRFPSGPAINGKN